MTILGITPARGGSKGIPRKNLRLIAGKPLLAWTIENALESKYLSRYVVSTEDPEIDALAQSLGAEVLKRPPELAQDTSLMIPVLQHALGFFPADYIVMLQATSPIRNAGLIDRCIEQFLNSGADSLATGWQCTYEPYGSCFTNRQERRGFFYDDGNVYVFKKEWIFEGNPYGKIHEKVPLDREQNVDIDEEFDFRIAEQILLSRLERVETGAER